MQIVLQKEEEKHDDTIEKEEEFEDKIQKGEEIAE